MDHKAYAKPGHLISGVSFVKTILTVCVPILQTPVYVVGGILQSSVLLLLRFCVYVCVHIKSFDSASIEDDCGKVVTNHQAVWQNIT